eukprot:m.1403 g.1403  ORF g.1403 m.1403 type:complete len:56 (+) comp6393_c0_seq1:429-596(+)
MHIRFVSVQSHAFKEATWDGKCNLPESDRERHLAALLLRTMEPSEEDILQGLEDL